MSFPCHRLRSGTHRRGEPPAGHTEHPRASRCPPWSAPRGDGRARDARAQAGRGEGTAASACGSSGHARGDTGTSCSGQRRSWVPGGFARRGSAGGRGGSLVRPVQRSAGRRCWCRDTTAMSLSAACDTRSVPHTRGAARPARSRRSAAELALPAAPSLFQGLDSPAAGNRNKLQSRT